MPQSLIPLNELRFGHEAQPPINVRKTGREDDIETLAASLHAHGLGQALNIRMMGDSIFVADGNRRLAALRLNAAKGLLAADASIRCELIEEDSDELSLALNIERVPMHEADQYEKFAELRGRGLDESQIAQRFGIELPRVKRILALGRLHSDILDAWRNGEFERDEIATVRAFTLAPSQKAQKEIYEQLKKKGRLYSHDVRDAFGAGNRDARRLLQFVGRESYLAAGGKLVEDLFGENHAISDYDLLKDLADQRLEREIEGLRGQGWSWANLGDNLPNGWSWTWQTLQPKLEPTPEEAAEIKKLDKVIGDKQRWEFTDKQRAADDRRKEIFETILARSFTEKDKARSGVAVSIGSSGELVLKRGLVKGKPKKEAPKAEGDGSKPAVSNAIMQRLSVQLTKAVGGAVVANPKTALAMVVAGLVTGGQWGQPMRVKAEGLLKESRAQEGFSLVLERLIAMSTEDLLVALAHEAKFMVDLQVTRADDPPLGKPIRSAFVERLEPGALQDALRQAFDADDYFRTIPRGLTEAAIAEAISEDEARRVRKLKKGELVEFAVANVPVTGWLPLELRTSTYAGPAADRQQVKAATGGE